MKKKICYIFVIAMLIILSLSLVACYSVNGPFKYVIEDDGVHMKLYSDISTVSEVVFPDEIEGEPVVALDDFAIVNTKYVKTITISKNISVIEPYAINNNTALVEFIVHPENKHFKAVDGTLYTIDGKELISNPPSNDIETFTVSRLDKKDEVQTCDREFIIPDGVEVIRENAFYHNNIMKIVFADSVISVGECAFLRVAYLEKLILSKNLESIGKDAFSKNTRLTELLINENIKSIGENAFFDCENLLKIDIKAKESDITFAKSWKPTKLGNKLKDLVVTFI